MGENWQRLGRLKSEEKVRVCMDMSDGCVRVCAEGIRNQFAGIKDDELIVRLRERLEWAKQNR
jgi:hypothetical protein